MYGVARRLLEKKGKKKKQNLKWATAHLSIGWAQGLAGRANAGRALGRAGGTGAGARGAGARGHGSRHRGRAARRSGCGLGVLLGCGLCTQPVFDPV